MALNDLVNKKFGRLTIISEEYSSVRQNTTCVCNCDCGVKNIKIRKSSIKIGKTQSCGCYRIDVVSKFITVNIGTKFGSLTIISSPIRLRVGKIYRVFYNCSCDCKKDKCLKNTKVRVSDLKSGGTKSCGCNARLKKWKDINERKRFLRKTNPVHRMRADVSREVARMLKNQGAGKNGASITKYLSYSTKDLTNYIESKFEPWMNWGNQGIYHPKIWDDNDSTTWTWQIDHVIPHSDLPYDSMAHPNFQKAWALSNLRPLSAKQNNQDGVNRTRHQKK